jgi:hypothetical protein
MTEFSFAFMLKFCSSSILTGEYFDISLVVVVVVVAVLVVDSGDNQTSDREAKTILDS